MTRKRQKQGPHRRTRCLPYEPLVSRQKCSSPRQLIRREKSGQVSKEHRRPTIKGCKQLLMTTRKEFEWLQEDDMAMFLDTVNGPHQGDAKARVIMDQVINYKVKKPVWSETTIRHCITLRNCSKKILRVIPGLKTCLDSHAAPPYKNLGSTSEKTGLSDLVKKKKVRAPSRSTSKHRSQHSAALLWTRCGLSRGSNITSKKRHLLETLT